MHPLKYRMLIFVLYTSFGETILKIQNVKHKIWYTKISVDFYLLSYKQFALNETRYKMN